MTLIETEGPPQQNGLTYHITNERGWNDPPTSVFSSSNNGFRKRIDPKKRVSHDINSGAGFYNPSKPLNGAFQSSTTNGFHQNFQNMSLGPIQQTLHHANSNPDLLNMNPNMAPGMHHAMSVPNKLYSSGNANMNMPGQMNGIITPPNSSCNTPPDMRCHSAETPPSTSVLSAGRKLSAPNDQNSLIHSDIFQQFGAKSMLSSSHLKGNSKATENFVANKYQPISTISNSKTSNTGVPVIQNSVQSYNYSQGSTFSNSYSPTPQMPGLPPMPVSPIPPHHQMSSLPPMPVTNQNQLDQNNLYTRSSSIPNGMFQRVSPTNAFVAPPPTNGFYVGKGSSKSNSPNNISPAQSGHNSPVPGEKLTIENDNQLLSDTVKRLNDCREKCSCYLTGKVSDDINKRIRTFQQSWTSGKLSHPVKLKMGELSEALNKREFTQADSIHKALIVKYSSEVMPWMVGIKKLISSYQQAMEENNKFQ